jgi:hypothetical protein
MGHPLPEALVIIQLYEAQLRIHSLTQLSHLGRNIETAEQGAIETYGLLTCVVQTHIEGAYLNGLLRATVEALRLFLEEGFRVV